MFACGIDVVSPLSLFPQSSLFFWVLPIFACEQFPLNCDLPQFSLHFVQRVLAQYSVTASMELLWLSPTRGQPVDYHEPGWRGQ